MQEMIDHLNQNFAVSGKIEFSKGNGGLTTVLLAFNDHSSEIYLQGAHVSSYRIGDKELLWMSKTTQYAGGQALRGGIPVCWPWFGQHESDSSRPQHGYARRAMFDVVETQVNEQYCGITLKLPTDQTEFEEWQDKVELELEIRLSDQLWMELRTTNCSNETIKISNALHTYFAVSDIANIDIPALTGLKYHDKTRNYAELTQSKPLIVDHNVDAIYQNCPQKVTLNDRGDNAPITIEKWGCENLVVWNPAEELAKEMADFDDAGYKTMICIEPANARAHAFDLPAGATQCSGQILKSGQNS